MLLAMVDDVRVVLIKLADRTHNMRTLGPLREEKRKRISRVSLAIRLRFSSQYAHPGPFT